jgi:hypothetical protein
MLCSFIADKQLPSHGYSNLELTADETCQPASVPFWNGTFRSAV